MTNAKIKHIEWIYARLEKVHKENPHIDYMVEFKSIIEEMKKGF